MCNDLINSNRTGISSCKSHYGGIFSYVFIFLNHLVINWALLSDGCIEAHIGEPVDIERNNSFHSCLQQKHEVLWLTVAVLAIGKSIGAIICNFEVRRSMSLSSSSLSANVLRSFRACWS